MDLLHIYIWQVGMLIAPAIILAGALRRVPVARLRWAVWLECSGAALLLLEKLLGTFLQDPWGFSMHWTFLSAFIQVPLATFAVSVVLIALGEVVWEYSQPEITEGQ
jgi:hypothetical protein